jgi:hypothetical protein
MDKLQYLLYADGKQSLMCMRLIWTQALQQLAAQQVEQVLLIIVSRVNIFGFVRAQRRSNNTIYNSSGFTGGIECISTIMQDFGLDLEEISLNGGGAAAPPQQGRKSEHELAFDSCSGIVICDDSCFKRSIVSNIFQSDDYSFSCQAVSDRVVPRPSLSIFGFRTGAAERIASIGFDLSKRSHPFARPSVFQETKPCASAADKWLAA